MAGYIGPIPVPQATQNRETFTATASQTSFATGGFQSGYLDVFMNGVKLVDGSDYTATNGSDVVLATGAAVNDIIEVVSYSAFEVLNQNFTGTTVVDDLTVGGDLTVTGTTITLDHANAQTVDLGDNDKIRLGDGDDLQLYHDGTHSYISDAGTGPLRIITDGTGILLNKTTTESMGRFLTDGAVELYYDNAKKFETSSTGVDISGAALVQAGNGATATLSLNNADGNGTMSQLNLGYTADPDHGNIKYTGDMVFHTGGNNERMRLTSGGTVFIGKSSADLSLTGIQATSSGQAFSVTRDGGAPFALNRKSSDGEIAGFYKDTVKVGSIACRSSGGNLQIHTNQSGIDFGGDGLLPMRGSSITDNSVNIGQSSYRFKDAYLSGGVFLGGTGSSNKLDDYEEGVYQFTISGQSSGTEAVRAGYGYFSYTKIGRMVKVMGRYELSGAGGASGALQFSLPFTQSNSLTDQADTGIGTASVFRSGTQLETVLRAVVYPGNNFFNVIRQTGTNSEAFIQGSHVDANYEGFIEITMLVD